MFKDLVKTIVKFYISRNRMFTVFDVTRTMRQLLPGETVDHLQVKKVVEDWNDRGDAFNSGASFFDTTWARAVGYHLPFSPQPQIYYNRNDWNHNPSLYDSNFNEKFYLEVNVMQEQPTKVKAQHKKVEEGPFGTSLSDWFPVKNNKTGVLYAVKHKTEERWAARERRYDPESGKVKRRSVDKLEQAGFWPSVNGPTQVLRRFRTNYKIVKYEVTELGDK